MPKKPPKLERLVLTLPEDQLRELERRAAKGGFGITLYLCGRRITGCSALMAKLQKHLSLNLPCGTALGNIERLLLSGRETQPD